MISVISIAKNSKEQLYFYPFFTALVQDIDHASLSRQSDVAAATLLRPSTAHLRRWSIEDDTTASSATAPDPTSPCQQPSTLVAVQLSGPILASIQIPEDDQVPYLDTRLKIPRAKKLPHLREAGAEQAIWRAIKKLR